MAQKLIEKGYAKVYALKGGWDEWVQSKYPLEQRIQESAGKTENDKKSSEKKE